MKQIISITIILTILIHGNLTQAQETSYPAGSNIQIGYSLNFDTLAVGDTLEIERTIVNNESFNLSGLYFSENLPPEFIPINVTLKVNGNDIAFAANSPVSNGLISGYNYYNWLVDSPVQSENVQYLIEQGDSLAFRIKLICNTPGTYNLPLHTATMFGNGEALFATSEPYSVTMTTTSDNTPPGDIVDLRVE